MRSFYTFRHISRFTDQLLMFLVPLMVYKLTQDVFWSGITFTIEQLFAVSFAVLGGQLADRMDPKKLLKISIALRVITSITVLALLPFANTAQQVYLLIVLGTATSIGAMLQFVCVEALIPYIKHRHNFTQIQSYSQVAVQLGMISAPLIAGIWISLLPWQWLVGITFILFLSSFLLLGFLKQVNRPKDLVNKEAKWQFVQPILFVFKTAPLLRIICYTAGVNLVFGSMLASAAPMITGVYQLSERYLSYLQTTAAIVSILLLTIIAKLTDRIAVWVIGVVSISMVAFGGLLSNQGFILFQLGFLLVIAFDGIVNIYIRSARLPLIPKENYAKTIGAIVLLNNITMPISGLLIASLASWYTLGETLTIIAVIAVVVILISYLSQFSFRKNT